MMEIQTLDVLLQDKVAMQTIIGQHVVYLGKPYEIIDFLQDEDTLVLNSEHDSEVQEDGYGRPHRLVPQAIMLKLTDEEGNLSHICKEIRLLP